MTEATNGFDSATADLASLRATLEGVILGQTAVVGELLTAFCAGGHVLLEGLPGLGKTKLVTTLAKALDLPLSRIQCTPDLLPGDVIGAEILSGDNRLEFRQGPLFAPLVLVDEINRSTPRTQAAFLEAMQERQISYLGRRYPLPAPYWILATQNPIELEGTFPLPEAQLDRFMAKVVVDFPAEGTLLAIADQTLAAAAGAASAAGAAMPACSLPRLQNILQQAAKVLVAGPLRQAAVNLILALQPAGSASHAHARQHLRYGPSPRSLQALLRCAQAHALLHGRPHVALADLQQTAPAVLRHRLLLRFDSALDGITADGLLTDVIAERLARLA